MAPTVLNTARIFEDPEPIKSPKSKRIPSVGDVLRGRRKENSPKKPEHTFRHEHASPSPLGERHINSPPQPKKVPLKSEDVSRPPMHKKADSSSSFKDLLLGRERSRDVDALKENKSEMKHKKNKSSTNLAGLLKKRSQKELREDFSTTDGENVDKRVQTSLTPIWAELRTPLSEQSSNNSYDGSNTERTVAREIESYTPKDYFNPRPSEDRDFASYSSAAIDFKPPQRPFLEHKSSRSSIFTENLDDEDDLPQIQRPKCRDQPAEESVAALPNFERSLQKDQAPPSPTKTDVKQKRSSRILDTIATLNLRSRKENCSPPLEDVKVPLSPQELDSAMENMLGRYDIPQNLRDQLRNLKPEVKAGLMKGDRVGSGSSDQSRGDSVRVKGPEVERPSSKESDHKDRKRSRSRSRTRSRILSFSKRSDASPAKQETTGRGRSKSRPKSADLSRPLNNRGMASTTSLTSTTTPDCAVMPGDFIHYLREVQKPELVEVGKLHKLRILLRNEAVTWTDAFVKKGGMDEIVQLLYRTMRIEWREEHEDNLLHETLLCLKGLSTTSLAMQRLDSLSTELFPALLKMLFDPERKGPAEYNTRGVVINLIFSHLSATLHGDRKLHQDRAHRILSFMRDASPDNDKQPLDFVTQMHTCRPYRTWCKEVTNVTKEVFWIFLHHLNVVPILGAVNEGENEFVNAYFPASRAPHPAAPYVGGVEWEATQYLAAHLDLLNGLIASLPTHEERCQVREDLRQSGWEKVMGGSMRTCKEKFYAAVHEGLKAWVSSANRDGWYVEDVRAGPPREAASPPKSPTKKGNAAPQIGLDVGVPVLSKSDDGWL